jgi:hypothetical protein
MIERVIFWVEGVDGELWLPSEQFFDDFARVSP